MEQTNYEGQNPSQNAQAVQNNTESASARQIVIDGSTGSEVISSNPVDGSFPAGRTSFNHATIIKKQINDESALYVDTRDALGVEEQILVRTTAKAASTVYNSENGKRAKYLSEFAEKGQYKNVSMSIQTILRETTDGTGEFNEIVDYPVKATLTLEVPHDAVTNQALLGELVARVVGLTTSASNLPTDGSAVALSDSCDKMMSLVRGNTDLLV